MELYELLQPMFDKFQKKCVQLKSEEIAQCIDEIKAKGMNLRAFDDAPSKRKFIKTFTSPGCIGAHGWIVEIDEGLIHKVLKNEQWRVAKDCREYADKLEKKINQKLKGEKVVTLTLDGNLWEKSSVNLTVESGKTFSFVTQTIVNKTKYGNYFFQFPTRFQQTS